jgi:hypothetical protein
VGSHQREVEATTVLHVASTSTPPGRIWPRVLNGMQCKKVIVDRERQAKVVNQHGSHVLRVIREVNYFSLKNSLH